MARDDHFLVGIFDFDVGAELVYGGAVAAEHLVMGGDNGLWSQSTGEVGCLLPGHVTDTAGREAFSITAVDREDEEVAMECL